MEFPKLVSHIWHTLSLNPLKYEHAGQTFISDSIGSVATGGIHRDFLQITQIFESGALINVQKAQVGKLDELILNSKRFVILLEIILMQNQTKYFH